MHLILVTCEALLSVPSILALINEEVIRRRLLIDGDGTGDDRRLNLLLKSILKYCNSPDDTPEEKQVNVDRMLLQLTQCEHAFEKSHSVGKFYSHRQVNVDRMLLQLTQCEHAFEKSQGMEENVKNDSVPLIAWNLTNSNNKKAESQNSRKTVLKSKQTTVSEKKEKSLIEHFDKEIQLEDKPKVTGPPSDVDDFDKETWEDPLQVSCYAMHIFEYLKSREAEFQIKDYLPFQSSTEKGNINAEMRSVLVDWMVEVQETFELNHETLYLAVKLVDLYLGKVVCSRLNLQLLGATAIFVSSKFDDRIPPQLSDLEYICSHTYSIQDLKDMEIKLVTAIGFDLGIPLSYRFLRRYARCNRIQLPLLTLARYILELSLMEYSLIRESDSKLACASLYLAQKMNKLTPWNKTLEYYSGYKVSCFKHIIIEMNRLLQCQPRTVMMQTLSTVYNKYSHPIFFEVAKTPVVKEADLFS
ncbi:G2/mitotic-specific cyclin-B3-like [Diaphorina citri]|uniref:G2/mitotic-specific cyclin-B3-like n=1 Tax=Diaphorina citri TaxID=121845 RepID=A0A1S3D5W0_DIACI|nr:G2/mitotic-specific cyclin-B3-like [Diaphorina citri]